jgi:nucleoside-diphosphate-sugar epimerase
MRRGMRGAEGVFHTAAWDWVGARDRATADAVNVGGTRNVLELVREMHVPRAVVTSTVYVLGDTKGAKPDGSFRHEGRLPTLADRTRWEALHRVALPMMRSGVPAVVAQPGVVYGPGGDPDVGRLLRRYLVGRAPVAPTGTAASWVHVEDAVAGHLLAMEAGESGAVYPLGGEDATLLQVMRMAGRLVGKRRGPLPYPGRMLRPVAGALGAIGKLVPPLTGPAERLRRRAGATYLCDDRRAREELGYLPRDLRDGLPDTVRSLLQDLFETG